MKRKFLPVLMIALLFDLSGMAQTNGPSFQKRQSNLTVSYGVGNFWKRFLNSSISQIPGITYDVTALGPVCLVYEYALTKRWSAGMSAAYSKVTGIYNGYGERIKDELKIFTLMPRVNYHFFVDKKWDAYVGGGAGLVYSRYNNDQSEKRNSIPGLFGVTAQAGCRYFFNSSVGASAEIGYVNGSFGQIGLVLRL